MGNRGCQHKIKAFLILISVAREPFDVEYKLPSVLDFNSFLFTSPRVQHNFLFLHNSARSLQFSLVNEVGLFQGDSCLITSHSHNLHSSKAMLSKHNHETKESFLAERVLGLWRIHRVKKTGTMKNITLKQSYRRGSQDCKRF